MTRLILRIYDLFRKRPFIGWGIFLVMTSALVISLLTLGYKEDISDFLPLDEKNQTALSVYQDVSGANRIYAIIATKDTTDVDPEELADGVETFAANVDKCDSLRYLSSVMKEIDLKKMMGITDIIYENIPLFLTDSDYARMDSLLSDPDYIERQTADDKQMLLFPSSNMIASNISRDPLNLFSPAPGRLRHAGMEIDFDTFDGYILTPDAKRAIVIMESSFGARESEHNTALADILDEAVAMTEKTNSNLDIHLIGGPVIAVANADRIKKDSILAISIAGMLILLLLIYVFRNLRNILLILVSVGWGWLFAMGALAVYYDSVSIIVIGIASVILGIAVNYPLHLIDHMKESDNPKAALREIISPLVVGNVTTVGAFLCLVPLDSPALHDLGLFASLLLIGTILFVLLFLPHAVKTRRPGETAPREARLINWLAGISLENNKFAVASILILTVIFGYFSLRTEFDSDMRNINYMTDGQKSDMAYFQSLLSSSKDTESLYVVSSGATWDRALAGNKIIDGKIDSLVNSGIVTRQNEVSSFLIPEQEQQHRLSLWNKFLEKHGERLSETLPETATRYGFSQEAFIPFHDILKAEYKPIDFEGFNELAATVFSGNISEDITTGRKSIVQVLDVPVDSMDDVKDKLSTENEPGTLLFDVKSMNGSIANTLSDDFNYIGFACGFIVFAFLWISFRSFWLAIIAFTPMAFSWIWILGIMGIFGIKFNIVNIILATFIFGQGDDYTIFITEGLVYEYKHGRKVLQSYKNSIIVSALIMFIGIGTLLFAQHPAMRSLGEITVIGMFTVVLMAYIIPPLMFRLLIRYNARFRNTLRRHD